MAYTAKRLYQGQLSATTSTVLATVTAGKTWIVNDIEITNRDTVARLLTLGMPGSGASHQLFSALLIAASETVQWSGHIVLNAAETITGGADAANVVDVTISGAEG